MTLRARLAPPQHAEFLLPTGNAISAVCFVLKNSNTGDPAGQENVDLVERCGKVAALLINTFAPSTMTI
jgi:hypothetical protein